MLDKIIEPIITSQKWDAETFFRPTFFWLGGLLIWLSTNGWNWELLLNILIEFKNYIKPLFGGDAELYFLVILFLLFLSLLIITRIVVWSIYIAILLLFMGPFLNLRRHALELNSELSIDEKLHEFKNRNKAISNILKLHICRLILTIYNFSPSHCLRALDKYLDDRYGLDLSVMVYLNYLLPENIKKDLDNSTEQISDKYNLLTWWIIFSIWAIWLKWVLLLSIVMSIKIYYFDIRPSICGLTYSYKLAFDLFRFLLYDSLHFPVPNPMSNEQELGRALTKHLSEIFPLDKNEIENYLAKK